MVLLFISSRNKVETFASIKLLVELLRKSSTLMLKKKTCLRNRSQLNLIQKDLVTCARSSDHMVQLFIHEVLKSDFMPTGEIADYLKRV